MAKHSREFYTCDCCGVEMDQPVRGGERGPIAYSAIISQDVGVAGGPIVKWQELCETCNSHLGKVADELSAHAKALRRSHLTPRTAGEGEKHG